MQLEYFIEIVFTNGSSSRLLLNRIIKLFLGGLVVKSFREQAVIRGFEREDVSRIICGKL